MSPFLPREHTERLRSIPLSAVLRTAGAEPDAYDKDRWHTRKGAISLSGMKFFNWNRACGGGGAIDLTIHLYDMDFKDAVAWLDSRFPRCRPPQPPPTPGNRPLRLPAPRTDKLPAVKRYLLTQRRVPPALIGQLIQAENLYADSHANAVFLLRAHHNEAVGAELRGTGPCPWRGMAPGSRRNAGFFSIRAERIERIILCESAIDAISCFALHPASWCISTAGVRANTPWLPALLEHRLPLYCGYDADCAGERNAQDMIRLHPAIRRLRPQHHDWNDTLRHRA
jgi:hypothetical protein